MKDFLAISFALDYDKEGGNPQKSQTGIGALRAQAKPYGGSVATAQTTQAADKLVEHCVTFLNAMECYAKADCIVAMPPQLFYTTPIPATARSKPWRLYRSS